MPKSVDTILNPSLIQVVFVTPFSPGFRPLIKRLEQFPALQVVECDTANEVVAVVRQVKRCLVVGHVRIFNDIAPWMKLLKLLEPDQKRNVARSLVTVNFIHGEDAKTKLMKGGALEVAQEPQGLKALLFRIDRQIRAFDLDMEEVAALPSLLETPAEKPKSEQAAPVGQRDSGSSGGSQSWAVRLNGIIQFASLSHDLFLLAGGGARRADGLWNVRLQGPRPEWGKWVDAPAGSDRWSWRSEDGTFLFPSHGEWVFVGAKPEYQNGVWSFVSERPSLAFLSGDGVSRSKLSLNDKGSLIVAADSKEAHEVLKRGELGKWREQVASVTSVVSVAETSGTATSSLDASQTADPSQKMTHKPGAIAIAFLVSELMVRPGVDLSAAIRRFCTQISLCCEGLSAELWVNFPKDAQWFCAGSSGTLTGSSSLPFAQRGTGVFNDENDVAVHVASVQDSHGNKIGSLVIRGKRAAQVDPAFAEAVAKIVSGMLLGLRNRSAVTAHV